MATLANGEPAAATNRCDAAIQAVRADIEAKRGAVVQQVRRLTVATWKRDNPTLQGFESPLPEADQIVVIALAAEAGPGTVTARHGAMAQTIMDSPQLTRRYAERIIAACQAVASVKFFHWEWYQGWSLFPQRQLREDRCLPPGVDLQLRWGENACL